MASRPALRNNPFIERLLNDGPQLHVLTEALATQLTALTGRRFVPGGTSWAVPPEVIRYFAEVVEPSHRTVETGSGHSTVALAALALHHTCITTDAESVELIKTYMGRIGLSLERITFIVEPSDAALPKLPLEELFDFAYVDGSHGYPMPALDWHYLDLRLKVGGTMGFDNTEIPAVHDHCEFLKKNQTYRLAKQLFKAGWGNYGAAFFVKEKDEPRWDGLQQYCRRRVSRNNAIDSLKTTISNISGKRWGDWPWS
jgi:hypothetical protein